MSLTADEVTAPLQPYAVDPWSSGDLRGLDESAGEGFVLHPDRTLQDSTLQDIKNAIQEIRDACPDLRVTIEETILYEGDKIAYRWTMRGTHQGEHSGIPPTGKPVTATGITILRVQDGKVIEDRFETSSPPIDEQVARD